MTGALRVDLAVALIGARIALAALAEVPLSAGVAVGAVGAVHGRGGLAHAVGRVADLQRTGGVLARIAEDHGVRFDGALARLAAQDAVAGVAVVLGRTVRVELALAGVDAALAASGRRAQVANCAWISVVARADVGGMHAARLPVALVGGAGLAVVAVQAILAQADAAEASRGGGAGVLVVAGRGVPSGDVFALAGRRLADPAGAGVARVGADHRAVGFGLAGTPDALQHAVAEVAVVLGGAVGVALALAADVFADLAGAGATDVALGAGVTVVAGEAVGLMLAALGRVTGVI